MFGVGLDLGAMGIDPGGVVKSTFTDRAGRNLAADRTGSLFQYQESFGQGEILRINEVSFEQTLSNKRLAVKGGFYPMGNDFATSAYFCNFLTNAICGHPLTLPSDSGWNDAPAGHWGARVKAWPTENVYVETGIFQVNSSYYTKYNGFKMDLSGSTGVILPLEVSYQIGNHPGGYLGNYKIGGYYDSSKAPHLSAPAREDEGREGVYAEIDQKVFNERPDSNRGLTLFAVGTLSDQNTAKMKTYWEAGAVYQGTFPNRDADTVNLGWAREDVNSSLTALQADNIRQSDESIVELNYGYQATRWWVVRPAVQYDIQPGAYASRPNTWVFVLGTKVIL
jgi:porin